MLISKISRQTFRWAILAALCASPVAAQQANSGRPGNNPQYSGNQGVNQPNTNQNGGFRPQAGAPNAGNNQPGSQQPGSQQPGSQQPGSQQPGSQQLGNQTQGNQPFGNRPQTGNPQSGQPQQQPQTQNSPNNQVGNQFGANQPAGNQLGNNPGQANMQPGNMQPGQPNQAQQQIPIVPLQNAVAGGFANVVKQPFPDLNEGEQKYIDQVLAVWEKRTAAIKTFECKFKRYVIEVVVDDKNPSTRSDGFIRFKNPDKGVFKEDVRTTLAGKKPDGSPDYKEDPQFKYGDWWVCDGEWVHNLNRNESKVVRVQLPPELRGNNIPLSPLPFLFGVKAAEVNARYFVRPLPPPPGNNDVWVEAWPKRADDAGNYSRVQIALDRNDSLPNAMIMFMPNWTPENPNREVFNFTNREVNSSSLLDKIKENIFMKEFIETKGGAGWKVIEEPWVPPTQIPQPQGPATANQPATNRVATPPQQQPPKR
ncbi:MAG: TIGR03009 domain-containing protein [Pirellulales bacterium]